MADPTPSAALTVLTALPARPAPEVPGPHDDGTGGDWPGVDDPAELRTLVARWLAGYGTAQTRRTYAYALGLPPEWADAVTGVPRPERPEHGRTPPPARRGRLHRLAFFRWCAGHRLDPRAVTAAHVTTWLHALDAAGAGKRTRARMLSTVSAFYAFLAEEGVLGGNPAALHRGRLGLAGTSRDPSPTIRLTAGQVRELWTAAADLPNRTRHRELYAARAVAFVALLCLGLRISEITGLDRDDLVVSGGERVLRVRGKGGTVREVFPGDTTIDALTGYLLLRDREYGDPLPARGSADRRSPLLATRDGGRCSRHDLHHLLRRIARAAGPALADVAERIHPHTLRHAYVTLALEAGAPIQHVQADVGHASIATTRHYDRSLRSRSGSAADLVTGLVTDPRPDR
ncbi:MULTISPECIES: tyrosine-type recombinase/integrase [unclassified Pseudonocardia]|uniref:tyrosine-type recombinase/integrase n=1 Tax=unclassified Pseudonocardia TaxID=2619320 RepID=UPI000967B310|nr:tyrosine-type recombinase/integrase [Pseudonocardia sp. Ae707_Ps1]OLM18793.1 Site-specific recombinase XerD [Pseudonocardia sp. Ae707_Ps1]